MMIVSFKLVLCLLPLFFSTIFAIAPKLLPFNSHFDLIENSTFPLTCGLFLGEGQISFQWSHNGVQLENSTSIRIDSSSSQFSLLTIRNLQQIHSGLYECRVVNSLGEADVTRTKIAVQGTVCLRFAQNVALRRTLENFYCIFLNFSFSALLFIYSLSYDVFSHNDSF